MTVYRELHPFLHGLLPVILMVITQLALVCVMIAFRDRHQRKVRLFCLSLFGLAAVFQLVCMRMEWTTKRWNMPVKPRWSSWRDS